MGECCLSSPFGLIPKPCPIRYPLMHGSRRTRFIYIGGSLEASGLTFGRSASIPASIVPTPIAFMQRMTDASIPESECDPVRWIDGRCWLGREWQGIAAMGLQALVDFNSRDSGSIPAFGNIQHCDKRLVSAVYDTESNGRGASASLINILSKQPLPRAIIGPARSVSSESTAQISGMFEIPQISYWSSSEHLSKTDLFPRFARTYPTDAVAAYGICALWKSLGYGKVGAFLPNDSYGEAYRQALVNSCQSFGVYVIAFSYDTGNSVMIEEMMAGVKASMVVAIHAAFFGVEDLRTAVTAAIALGLMGSCEECGYMWSLSDSIGASDLVSLSPELRKAFNGTIAIYAVGGTNSQWVHTATQRWPGFIPERLNRQMPAQYQFDDDFFNTFDAISEPRLRDGAKLNCRPQGVLPSLRSH